MVSMRRTINRIPPRLPVGAMKTYSVSMPLATHWRPATCAEVDCPHHLKGWATTVPISSSDEALIRRAASGTVDGHRRHFTETRVGQGLVRFAFPPGQVCFAANRHRLPLDRPGIFVVRGGDWRGNPSGWRRVHRCAADWLDDCREHADKIITRIGRG